MNIFEAAKHGNVNRVRTLLNQGVNVNSPRQGYGYTPLMIAAIHGRVHVVRLLLNRGANAKFRSFFGTTALHYASNKNVIRMLLPVSNVKAQSNEGNTAVSSVPRPNAIRALMRGGVKLKYSNNYTPTNTQRNLMTNMMVRRGAASRHINKMHTATRVRKSKARTGGNNNTLARAVFSPARVKRMQNKYGKNWLNHV